MRAKVSKIRSSSPGGRPYDTNYSSGVIATLGGQRLLISGSGDGAVYAIKPQTGERVWGFMAAKRAINTGVAISGNRVFISHGDENLDTSQMGMLAALDGTQTLEEITLRNRDTGEERKAKTHWLFICIGGAPRTDWAAEVGVIRDEAGYLVTGVDLLRSGARPSGWPLDRDPYPLETSAPGIFAAGDVRHGCVKRCASAVGDGAMAIAFVHRYLAEG